MITITKYKCEYCKRERMTPESIQRHEPHCYGNPNRTANIGEITSWYQLSVYYDGNPPAWWPGCGKIWDGKKWLDIPGYRKEHFGEDDYTEQWPDLTGEGWPDLGLHSYNKITELPNWLCRLQMVQHKLGIEHPPIELGFNLNDYTLP